MLLERDVYLDQLEALLGEAMKGAGRAAFVAGEAGIGKTSLLAAFSERTGSSVRVLHAACEDLSAPETLSLLRDLTIVDQRGLENAERGQSRLALFAEVLANLASEPTVLILEDIHWADDASLDFIRFIGRRLTSTQLLLLASSRNDGSDAKQRLHRAAADVPAAARTLIELPRLSSVAVGKLAAARGLIGHAIHDATAGNPLFVSEMLSAKGERPAMIDDLVVSKAGALSNAARALMELCSIYPRRTPYQAIAAANIVDAAIDECLASGMLVPAGEGLGFRHELIRQAVEHSLPPFRRQRLHAAALAQLEVNRGSAARCLHHALGAKDSAKIRVLAPAAAEKASAMGSHRGAAQAWRSLLDLDGLDGEAEAQARERYAFELHMFGALSEAIDQQASAISIHASQGAMLKVGNCQRFLSRLHYLNGQRAAAEAIGSAAVACLEPFGESAELALAYANLAHLAMLGEDMQQSVQWSERAEKIALRFDRTDILATIYNNWGTAIQFADPVRAAEMVERSIELGLAAGTQEHVARAYTNLGWLKLQGLDLEAAEKTLVQGESYCIDNELSVWRDYMAGTRALALVQLGRWEEAEQISREIVARDDNTLLMRNPAVRALAQILVRRGDPGADVLIDELRRHMDQGREVPRFAPYASLSAELAWTSARQSEAALSLIDEAVDMLGPDHNAHMRQELEYWRSKLRAEPPRPLRPAAIAKSDDLHSLVQAAADHWDCKAMPFETALALSQGDDLQARMSLEILAKLGATATEARVRSELAARGLTTGSRGPRASTRSNPYQLTRREMEILQHLDRGLTNKQIGDTLFVSAKTVDHHVTSILGKLDARNRGEAAAKARRERLIPEADGKP